jgi:hypothetical protein
MTIRLPPPAEMVVKPSCSVSGSFRSSILICPCLLRLLLALSIVPYCSLKRPINQPSQVPLIYQTMEFIACHICTEAHSGSFCTSRDYILDPCTTHYLVASRCRNRGISSSILALCLALVLCEPSFAMRKHAFYKRLYLWLSIAAVNALEIRGLVRQHLLSRPPSVRTGITNGTAYRDNFDEKI